MVVPGLHRGGNSFLDRGGLDSRSEISLMRLATIARSFRDWLVGLRRTSRMAQDVPVMTTFSEIERIEVDAAAIAAFTSERDYTGVAFHLLTEVASYACVAACILGPTATWNRDQAA